MKPINLVVAVGELPGAGLEIRGRFDTAWLGDSIIDAYEPLGPLEVAVDVRRIGDNVHVEGSLRVELGFRCSRTLQPGRTTLEVSMGELFQPAGAHKMKLGAGVQSEDLEGDEPYVFEGDVIDLEPFLREQLVLAQEPYPRLDDPGASAVDDAAPDAPVWRDPADEGDLRWGKLRGLRLDA